jgi:PAS domain S-box-containing protein
MWGKEVGMSPRQQPTSRRYKNEGNADPAVEHQAPLTIVTEQISPANLEHKRNDFFTREQRWLTAFESSAIGITMADLDGHYLAANTVFQNMVGYAEAELKEFSFLDITYEEDRGAKLKLVRELVEGRRKHFQIEKRYRRKDGTLLWVRNNISLASGSRNVPPFLFTVAEGITRWKRAEEELHESERLWRTFLENSPSPIFLKDPQGRYLHINREFERVLRVTEEQIKPADDARLKACFPATSRSKLATSSSPVTHLNAQNYSGKEWDDDRTQINCSTNQAIQNYSKGGHHDPNSLYTTRQQADS